MKRWSKDVKGEWLRSLQTTTLKAQLGTASFDGDNQSNERKKEFALLMVRYQKKASTTQSGASNARCEVSDDNRSAR
jgi:hypothetical protein